MTPSLDEICQEDRDWVLGIVSHELRTSLSAITLSSMALARGPATSVARNVARILFSARRMNGIIDDLLDLSKARRGGGIEIKPTLADAHEICKRIVDELETANPGREIRLLLQGDANGCWDANRLEQVVSNLISNALQYGAEEAPITIESQGSATHWTLSVHNLGNPIPPATLPRLYKPFERGTDTGARQAGARNLGIGLFIVRQLVLGHGGTIDARSSATEGTWFVVRLPRGSLSSFPQPS
jgi:sigma-B regulation protein RsbU (phosphoserine phosphatase)